MVGERACGVSQQSNGLHRQVRHDRSVHVEFEVALASSNRHRGLIAEDLHTDLRQRFDLGGIHFARHDGRTGFVLGQRQFAKAGTGSAAEKPDVICDLEERYRHGVERAMCEDQRIATGDGFERIRGRHKRQPRQRGDPFDDTLGETGRRIETRTDRSPALCHREESGQCRVQPTAGAGHLRDVTGELLTERQRHGVL